MAKTDLTAQRLRELLHYDPETGVFTWRVQLSMRAPVGRAAGVIQRIGYRIIGIEGTRHYAHRLAWLHVNGQWPKHHVDHMNGVKSDNRIANLRDVSRSVNLQNMRAAPIQNKTRLIGATWDKSRNAWSAQIRILGKNKALGRFPTAQEAHEAYITAKRQFHEGCTI